MTQNHNNIANIELVKHARTGNVSAFEKLIQLYFSTVYGVAFARLGNPAIAEDLTQEVFLRAYLNIKKLKSPEKFLAWLLKITRNLSITWQRKKQETSQLITKIPLEDLADEKTKQSYDAIAAREETKTLHRTVFQLPADFREIIVLHYFQGMTKKQIAEQLGVHPTAIDRKIKKALSLLKHSLEPALKNAAPVFKASAKTKYRTIALVAAASAMSAKAKAALVTASVISVTSKAAAAGGILGLSKTTATTILTTGVLAMKAKTIAAIAIAVTALTIAGTVTYKEFKKSNPPTPATQETTEANSGWRERFYEVYYLENDEILWLVSPPFIPEREQYYKSEHASQAEAIPRGPDVIAFHWDEKLKNWGMSFGSSSGLNFILEFVLGLESFEYEGPEELLGLQLPGDWIIRNEVSQEIKLKALEQLITEELDRTIRFEKRTVERQVIVATGSFEFHPLSMAPNNNRVYMFSDKFEPDAGGGGGTANSVSEFLTAIGDRVNVPIVDETQPSGDMQIDFDHHRSAYLRKVKDEAEKSEKLDMLLANITEQTELQFEVESRPVEIWFVTE